MCHSSLDRPSCCVTLLQRLLVDLTMGLVAEAVSVLV